MLIVSIISTFPNLFKEFTETGIIKKAVERGKVSFCFESFLSFVAPKVRIDAPTVGPGPGMVIKPEVVDAAIQSAENKYGRGFRIFFTPQGVLLSQTLLKNVFKKVFSKEFSGEENPVKNNCKNIHLILVCFRYEGVDERVFEVFADLELSIGNYVLLGGELPAQVFLEAFVRLLPGVLNNNESIVKESFESALLDYPEYCNPDVWRDKEIPVVLKTGNHEKIATWRESKAGKKTFLKKFNWFRSHADAYNYKNLFWQTIPEHYVVLLHSQVKNKDGESIVTSIKSMDLHDISRSAKTYGIRKFFIVQPLIDQQEIIKSFYNFWTSVEGDAHNFTRQKAVENIKIANDLAEVLAEIRMNTGKDPLLIATSARKMNYKTISYNDQGLIWEHERPVLILLGTGYGLDDSIIEQADFVLQPLAGFTEYNHLSVRCAAAIIFDRWLGYNSN